ncbi:MAG: PAS domain S-box protein [Chloroflexi bacterium]|nr:PAS domain S-box protein [Chloroflexota bacterium]
MECAIPVAMGVLNGERATSEWVFIAKDGARKYGEVISTPLFGPDGEVTGALGVGRDITERKRMEEALRLSERDYKVLFESTLDGLIVLDAETMKIVLANQTAAKVAGVSSADALMGLDPFEFIPEENREAGRNIVREDVFEKDLHRIHEYRVFTADGKEAWVSAVSTRTEYRGRKAALISIRDITERKKAEEEKQKMEEQLRLAGRLAAVGELAAGVAHELNNPIAAVQGYAQLLSARKDIDESVKKDLNIIYREAQRAGKITKNLLSFARRHEPEKRFISINEAIEKTLELSAHQMKIHNVELEVELDQNLPGTMADFHQMQQVFVNIINNAEQAMLDAHGKGKLVVRTRRYGDMIQVVFTDDGPGIAEENLKRIFDPFFTTKGVGKGTGLGLSICYGLVEAHNGRIYARSKIGEGATFVVEIPVVPEEVPDEAAFIKTKRGSVRWRK